MGLMTRPHSSHFLMAHMGMSQNAQTDLPNYPILPGQNLRPDMRPFPPEQPSTRQLKCVKTNHPSHPRILYKLVNHLDEHLQI